MGTKHYMHMDVASNLDAAIALARTLWDKEAARIYESVMTLGVPAFCEITDRIWKECYLTLNDAARHIGYSLEPISDVEGTKHWVEVRDFYSCEPVGVWNGHTWIQF